MRSAAQPRDHPFHRRGDWAPARKIDARRVTRECQRRVRGAVVDRRGGPTTPPQTPFVRMMGFLSPPRWTDIYFWRTLWANGHDVLRPANTPPQSVSDSPMATSFWQTISRYGPRSRAGGQGFGPLSGPGSAQLVAARKPERLEAQQGQQGQTDQRLVRQPSAARLQRRAARSDRRRDLRILFAQRQEGSSAIRPQCSVCQLLSR